MPMYCSERCKDNAAYARKSTAKGRRAESCERCGTSLIGTDARRRFCSDKCSNDFRNKRISMAAIAEKLANRKPCIGCGGEIPAERTAGARYCSESCKILSRRHAAYGLTKQELDLLLAQHEECAICKTIDWGVKGPCVDHDHVTGKIRGILCGSCNQGLGRFADDPKRLRAAADYLERWA